MTDESRFHFPLYTIIGSVFGIAFLAFCLLHGGTTFYGDLLVALSLGFLGFSLDSHNGGRGRRAVWMVTTYMVLYLCGATSNVFLYRAPVVQSLYAALGSSYPVLLGLPLLLKMKGLKRGPAFWITAVGSVLLWCCSRYYSDTFLYLYGTAANQGRLSSLYSLVVSAAIAFCFLEILLKTERNAFGYLMLLGLLLVDLYRNMLPYGFVLDPVILLGESTPLLLLLFLIIYIRVEKEPELQEDRKVVSFSHMVYEELRPIKKRTRAQKFEIPPNVPVVTKPVKRR